MPDNSKPGKPRIFAHRGTTLLAPENTIAAFDLALHYECDVLETDVRLSKDNAVMVTHDQTVDRTTNGTGNVRHQTCAELKKLNASCKFKDLNGHAYDGATQTLLTLDELFVRYPDAGINIDIKDNDPQAAIAVTKSIKQRINNKRAHEHQNPQPQKNSSTQWINVGSFHANVIKMFRKLAPSISTAATRQEVALMVFGRAVDDTQPYQLLQIPQSYWGIQLSGRRLIKKAHTRRCEVMYWTINDKKRMRALLQKGADGIVTDRPDFALEVFQSMDFK